MTIRIERAHRYEWWRASEVGNASGFVDIQNTPDGEDDDSCDIYTEAGEFRVKIASLGAFLDAISSFSDRRTAAENEER